MSKPKKYGIYADWQDAQARRREYAAHVDRLFQAEMEYRFGPAWRQVPFAHGQGRVTGVTQEPGESGSRLGQPRVVARESERDVGQEKLARLAAFLRRGGPLLADARMEDLLKRALLFRVGEDYRSKCAPIQISVCRKNFNTKPLSQKALHLFVPIGQLTRRPVGIKKSRARQLLQAAGESGFAGGNAAGDPDDGAGL